VGLKLNGTHYLLVSADDMNLQGDNIDMNSINTASVVKWSLFLVTVPEVRVRFPTLPDFLRSSGCRTGSTQPRE
jgi:hypothetical protein